MGHLIIQPKAQLSLSYFGRAIEQARMIADSLEWRDDSDQLQQSHLLDLDSDTGRNSGKAHLDCIDRLIHILELERSCRRYRGAFTESYK